MYRRIAVILQDVFKTIFFIYNVYYNSLINILWFGFWIYVCYSNNLHRKIAPAYNHCHWLCPHRYVKIKSGKIIDNIHE